MKVYLMKPMIALLLFVGVAPSGWAVDDWWQGALCLSDSTGGMAVELLGGQRLDVAAAPVYTSGLVKLIADQGGQSIYLRASNAVAGYFAGAGQFSIERFDQFRSAASGTNDRSYMIGNLLEGLLILDNREQAQGSEIIIETALGRVSVTQGLVSLQINYNSKNQHYNFIFVCSEGVLSLRHASGRSYQVTPGQRLSGVGFAKAPSIELSDATAAMKEPIIEFTARMEGGELDCGAAAGDRITHAADFATAGARSGAIACCGCVAGRGSTHSDRICPSAAATSAFSRSSAALANLSPRKLLSAGCVSCSHELILCHLRIDFERPGMDSASHINHVLQPLCAQIVHYTATTHAMVAVDNECLIARHGLDPFRNFGHRNMQGPVNLTNRHLRMFAHIEKRHFILLH
jgi:hypothetical protein